MGRPGKKHLIDPFRATEMLCGLARVHHHHTGDEAAWVADLELCSRCAKRRDELRGVMRTGKASRVFEQPCSTCGAPAGMPCLTTLSQPHTGHAARVRLERALNRPKDARTTKATARCRRELKLVLDWPARQDARSSDRRPAPPPGETSNDDDGGPPLAKAGAGDRPQRDDGERP